MNTTFAMTLLAGAAYAQLGSKEQRYINHNAQYNVNIRSAEEYRKRQLIFSENCDIIDETNRKADESGNPQALRLAHNFTSTMTEDELEEMMGIADMDIDWDDGVGLDQDRQR